MYAQIVIDCQTKKEPISCEYCIVKNNCRLRLVIDDTQKASNQPPKLSVFDIDSSCLCRKQDVVVVDASTGMQIIVPASTTVEPKTTS